MDSLPVNPRSGDLKVCPICKMEFTLKRNWLKKKYCSVDCAYESLKGKPKTQAHRANIAKNHHRYWKGKKKDLSQEERLALSMRMRGNKFSYKNGSTPEQKRVRNSLELLAWKKAVYKKNNYECLGCGEISNLHAHHIKSFARYPELRFDIDNGVALCKTCHKKMHSGRKIKNV